MWWILAIGTAWASELVVAAHVPTQIVIGGQTVAELYQNATVHVDVPPGTLALTLYVNGKPQDMQVDVPTDGAVTVMVGKTGITTGTRAEAPSAAAAGGRVEFRVAGGEGVTLQLDNQRHRLSPGDVLSLDLSGGDHPLVLRDRAGTLIWARGSLRVDGPMIVQLAGGRVPEVTSDRGGFVPDSK